MRRTDQRIDFLLQSLFQPFRSAALCSPSAGVLYLKSATLVDTGTLSLAADAVAKYIAPKAGETVITNDPGCGSALWSDITFVTGVSFSKKSNVDAFFVSRLRLRPRLKNAKDILRLPPFALPKGAELDVLKAISEQPSSPREFLSSATPHLKMHLATAESLSEGLQTVLKDHKKYSWEDFIENSRQVHAKRLEDLPLGQFRIQRDLGSWGRLNIELQNSAKGIVISFEGSDLHNELSLTTPMTTGICLAAVNAFFRVPVPISMGHFQNLSVQTPMRSALDGKISNLTPLGPLVFASILANTIIELLSKTVKGLAIGEPGFSLAISCLFEDGQILFDSLPGGSGGSHQFSGQDGIDVWTRLSLQQSIEELERNFPVTVERHEKRANSGGRGQFAGGDGLRRTYRFDQAATVWWLPSMTRLKADGFLGGSQGDSCLLTLVRADGTEVEPLPDEFQVFPGDRITVLSSGGGGFGKIES